MTARWTRWLVLLSGAVAAGCGGTPLFVPEAGPNAPGFAEHAVMAPPAPQVRIEATGTRRSESQPAGAIDTVTPAGSRVSITGWAMLPGDTPRGILRVWLPPGAQAVVRRVDVLPRADVVTAIGDPGLAYSGFTVVLDVLAGSVPRLCIESESRRGTFLLAGSDLSSCPN